MVFKSLNLKEKSFFKPNIIQKLIPSSFSTPDSKTFLLFPYKFFKFHIKVRKPHFKLRKALFKRGLERNCKSKKK
jgi:hypothetical protein